jgi:hypothetical protein
MDNNAVKTIRTSSVIRAGKTRFNVDSVYDADVRLEDLLLNMAEQAMSGKENLLDKDSDAMKNLRYNELGN